MQMCRMNSLVPTTRLCQDTYFVYKITGRVAPYFEEISFAIKIILKLPIYNHNKCCKCHSQHFLVIDCYYNNQNLS